MIEPLTPSTIRFVAKNCPKLTIFVTPKKLLGGKSRVFAQAVNF